MSLTILFALPAQAQNLILNPSFESDGTNWIFVGQAGPDPIDGGHTGTKSAYVNAPSFGSGSVSQTISTTPGATYLVDFFLSNNGFLSGGTLSVSFDGYVGLIITPASSLPGSYTEYTFLAPASGSTATFLYAGDNLATGTAFIDDVSVTFSSIPEPSTFSAIAGLGALGLVVWRRPGQFVPAS